MAAVSCGIHQGLPVLDLDYEEDSAAEADSNFVLTGAGDIVEIQATGEKRGFTRAEFDALFGLAAAGVAQLHADAARRRGGWTAALAPGDGRPSKARSSRPAKP